MENNLVIRKKKNIEREKTNKNEQRLVPTDGVFIVARRLFELRFGDEKMP